MAAADLTDVIAAGDAEALTRILAAGAPPGSRDPDGLPFVILAADTGDVNLVRPFLDAGLPVDTEDDLGHTPLTAAVQAAAPALVDFLIQRGANADHRTRDLSGNTVLTAAFDEIDPHTHVISALLAAGADPNAARADGWTPLMLAAWHGDTTVVAALLAAGADPHTAKDAGRTTAMGIAAHRGHEQVIGLLRRHGAANPVTECAARLDVLWHGLGEWYAVHAPPYRDALNRSYGIEAQSLEALATELNTHLPVDLQAQLLRHGGSSQVAFGEYTALSAEHLLDRWRHLETMRHAGTFDGWAPAELQPDDRRVRYTWWHPGWIPFAEDGGGNLYCIDLDPGPVGVRGQVIGWEVHGGPFGPMARSFEDYLRRYHDAVTGGEYAYHVGSGLFART